MFYKWNSTVLKNIFKIMMYYNIILTYTVNMLAPNSTISFNLLIDCEIHNTCETNKRILYTHLYCSIS